MQGNCPAATTPPPNPTALGLSSYTVALRPLKPYQCLLLVNAPLLRIKQSQLWLQGLYVRLSKPRDGPFKQFVEVVGRDSQLWITDVTMQVMLTSSKEVLAVSHSFECGDDVCKPATLRTSVASGGFWFLKFIVNDTVRAVSGCAGQRGWGERLQGLCTAC